MSVVAITPGMMQRHRVLVLRHGITNTEGASWRETP